MEKEKKDGWRRTKRSMGGIREGQGEVRRNAVTVDRGPVLVQVLQDPARTTKNEQNEKHTPAPRFVHHRHSPTDVLGS